MKFEIVGQEIKPQNTVKAAQEIDDDGDLLLYINGILIAYIECIDGRLMRCELELEDVKRLKEIGIMIEDDGDREMIKTN